MLLDQKNDDDDFHTVCAFSLHFIHRRSNMIKKNTQKLLIFFNNVNILHWCNNSAKHSYFAFDIAIWYSDPIIWIN